MTLQTQTELLRQRRWIENRIFPSQARGSKARCLPDRPEVRRWLWTQRAKVLAKMMGGWPWSVTEHI